MTIPSSSPGIFTTRTLIAQLLHGRVRMMVAGLTLLLLGNSAALALPVTAKLLIDDAVGQNQTRLLWLLSASVLGAAIIQALGTYFSARIVSVGAQQAIAGLRSRLHAHILELPVRFFNGASSGMVTARVMHDVDALRMLMGSGMLQLVGAVFTACLALGALFWLNWSLTLAVLILLIVVGLLMAGLFARSRPLVRRRSQAFAELSARLTESITAIRLIKAYGAEAKDHERFVERAAFLFSEIRQSLHVTSLMSVLSITSVALLSVTTIQIGGRAMIADTFTAGDLVAYFVLVGLLAVPLTTLSNQGPVLSEAIVGLERVASFLSLATEPASVDQIALPRLSGSIEFQDVSFAYEPGQPILQNATFTIPAGSFTAIVGLSGAGKSTLLALIMGLDVPQSGRILVDGRDLHSLPRSAYRAQLGVVLQDECFFEGTIIDNVRFGVPDATEFDVENACRLAHVLEFTDRFPQGLHSWVGERGLTLSGGQRQRVAIARAILRDPTILLLDEATSHLDLQSEAYIQAGLAPLLCGCTTVMVAHRPSTIERADQVLTIEHGRVWSTVRDI